MARLLAVKRWLLIVLLLLVPLQFGWAGVSAACADEAGFVHLHEADGEDHAEASAEEEGGGCQHCHAHLTPLPSRHHLAAAASAAQALGAAPAPRRASAPGLRPERPQWIARA